MVPKAQEGMSTRLVCGDRLVLCADLLRMFLAVLGCNWQCKG